MIVPTGPLASAGSSFIFSKNLGRINPVITDESVEKKSDIASTTPTQKST